MKITGFTSLTMFADLKPGEVFTFGGWDPTKAEPTLFLALTGGRYVLLDGDGAPKAIPAAGHVEVKRFRIDEIKVFAT